MRITFFGAASEVTGSQHLLETRNLRILLDCGFFQGRRAETRERNERLRCNPKQLDGVVLSHAHIDHCGNLPGLYRAGYRGPIFCTAATADVTRIMLEDSAKIQAEDARYLSRHLAPGHPPVDPLYTVEHVQAVCRQFETVEYGRWEELSPEFKLKFSDAGHILGSAVSEIQIQDRGEMRRVVYTGDLGRRGNPLLRDPELVGGCDVLISESTYGNRVHAPPEDMKVALLRILNEAIENKGKVIIPAFSLGRTQQIVYYLNELSETGLLPTIPVFVDSPLSMRLTDVYRQHSSLLNEAAVKFQKLDPHLFDFAGLEYVTSQGESAELNRRQGPFVVISASGMCESGRIVHHLKHGVADPRNTIVIIGFQAQNTLGRRIVERQKYVRIFDREYPLRAKVEILNGLSAHADVEDFKWWFEHMAKTGGIGQAFLVHGEPQSARSLAELMRPFCDEEPVIPELYQTFEVPGA